MWRFSYDIFGNLVARLLPRPNTGSTSEYDSRNRLSETENGEGERIRYGYDSLGRKVLEEYVTPEDAVVRTISYVYDNPADELDDPRSLWKVIEGESTTEFFYDAARNRTRVVDDDGNAVQYTFDALNRVETMTQGGATTRYAYTPRGGGNLQTVTDAEGHVTSIMEEIVKDINDPPRYNYLAYNCQDWAADIQRRCNAKVCSACYGDNYSY